MQFALNPISSGPAMASTLAGNNAAGMLVPTGGAASAPAPFSELLTDVIGRANRLEDEARIAVDGLMTGSGVDVHQAMIATQKASMAFELALAVRNKAVQAYQQVIGMQF